MPSQNIITKKEQKNIYEKIFISKTMKRIDFNEISCIINTCRGCKIIQCRQMDFL